MTRRIIIGKQTRILQPRITSDAFCIASNDILINPNHYKNIFANASQIIVASWFRNADGKTDISRSSKLGNMIAELSNKNHERIILLSTDAVFNGQTGHYRSNDKAAPFTDYGKAKLSIESALPHANILRFTVFGPSYSNRPLISEMIMQQQPVTLFESEYFSPVSTHSINNFIMLHRDGNIQSGIHHIASDRISKAELFRKISKLIGVKLNVKSIDHATVNDFSLIPNEPRFFFDLDIEIMQLLSSIKH